MRMLEILIFVVLLIVDLMRLVYIPKICVNINISILIFVSTCKQLAQFEHLEFSKNGVFHNKGVVVIFSK